MAATGIDAKIADLLLTKAQAMTLPQTTGFALPDVKPASGFPVDDEPYLKLFFIPASPDQMPIGAGSKRHSGLFQISIMWPAGQGILKALNTADVIQQEFDKGTKLSDGSVIVRIISRPDIGQGIIDGDRTSTPVTIEYESFNT